MTRRNRTFRTDVARAYQCRRSWKPAEHQASGAITISGLAAQATFVPGGNPFNRMSENHTNAIRIAATTTCHQRRRTSRAQLPAQKIVGLASLLRTERATAGTFTAATQSERRTIGHWVEAHPDLTLAALQTWLLAEQGVRLSNGAMWSAVARLGLSFKKRRSARANRTARMSRRGAASGRRRGRMSIPTSLSSSTRPAPAPR
jgi:hypothetical protein